MWVNMQVYFRKISQRRTDARRRSALFVLSLLATVTSPIAPYVITTAQAQSEPAPQSGQSVATFDIAPQPMAKALMQFSEKTGIQLFYNSSLVNGLQSPGVRGTMTAEAALKHMLAGSGLAFKFTNATTIAIEKSAAPASTTSQPDGVTPLPPIDVKAKSDLPDPRHTPGTINVITAEELEKKGVAKAADALRTVPGVNIVFGSNGTKGISLDGLGTEYTLILIDGKRVNAANTTLRGYNGDLDWIPISSIERIEVLQGPAAATYGAGAVGGVVNIVTKKGGDHWTGSLTAENFQPESGTTGATRRLSGFLSGPLVPEKLSATVLGDVGKRNVDKGGDLTDTIAARGVEDYNVLARLSYTPTTHQTIELEGSHGREKYIPYLTDGETDTSKTTIDRTTASLRHIGDWSFGNSTTTAYFETATNESHYAGTKITSRLYSIDNKLKMPFDFGLHQEATLGGEFRQEELHDPVNLGTSTSTPDGGDDSTSAFTTAVFLQDEIHITDALRLTPGLRYDYHQNFGSHFNPLAYVAYDLTNALTLKGGWSRTFKAPELRQLDSDWVQVSRGRGCAVTSGTCEIVGNPGLKPEVSNSYEAGFVYDDHTFSGGFTWFYHDIKNQISSELIDDSGTTALYRYINIGRAVTQGIQANASIPIGSQLNWSNSLTYLIESRDKDTGNPLSEEPKLSAHSTLSWTPREDLVLTGTLDYYGKQVDYQGGTADSSAAENISPYAIVSFTAKYDLTDNFTVKAGVNNIFDQQPKTDSNYKEDGRTYYTAITAHF